MPIRSTTEALGQLALVSKALNSSTLSMKIAELKHSRSNDRIQQLQTEAIIDLYDAVRQIQEAIWPMLQTIPDVGAVKQAAQAAGGSSATVSATQSMLLQGTRLTR